MLVVLALGSALAGCAIERHYGILQPNTDQVIEATSGDRFFCTLDENSAAGYMWDYTCDDSDVEVIIDHKPAKAGRAGAVGKAEVTVRVHRGYDGPSNLRFFCKRPGAKRPISAFSVSLFRRTGDEGFWK